MSDQPSTLARMREVTPPNPTAIGTSNEIADLFHAYADIGLDEFVVSDGPFRADEAARFDSMDRNSSGRAGGDREPLAHHSVTRSRPFH